MKKNCPLCSSKNSTIITTKEYDYYRCHTCFGIYQDSDSFVSLDAERERYELHDSDVEDAGYQNFVSPITSSIFRDFDTLSKGLDFGAGVSAIVATVLEKNGYMVDRYDPFFHNNEELLSNRYDYIASCEVIEHFHNPKKEFELLRSMLKSGSKLYLMTHLYSEDIDFSSWYYKNDPTHIFFYSTKTVEYIKKEFGFMDADIDNRLITLHI